MAKLNGVQTIDMVNGEITKVAYNGEEYAKVSGGAQIGDLVRPNSKWESCLNGEFYACVDIDPDDDARVETEYGYTSANYRRTYELFRKVSATTAPSIDSVNAKVDVLAERVTTLEYGKGTLKTEKRHAKVGDRILITKAEPIYTQSYKVGDILTVTKADVIALGDVHVEGQSNFIDCCEYEVIVDKLIDKPAQEITHKGVEYTLVVRKARAGDVVVFTENTSRCVINDEPYVVYIDVDGEESFKNGGSSYSVYFDVYNRTEANTLVYAPKVEPLKVGDCVVFNGGYDFGITNEDMTLGKVVRVIGRDDIVIEVVAHAKLSSSVGETCSVEAKYFRKATAEEIAEATKPKYVEGDIVVITANTNGSRNKVGDIGKIGSIDPQYATVDVPERSSKLIGNYTRLAEMRHATPAEIAEYERSVAQAEKDAVFAKLGRKPNEFKKGDIVRLTEFRGGHCEGTIAAVEEFTDSDEDCVYIHTTDLRSATMTEYLELIAPVESRVDAK